ncbi:iron-sulfur cluster biosynthesis family protein [Agrilactobacillus yilanensis]|uniref:Iron-sulfur cluster biosynthesis family protein n=1 Tax=Agrilactobacillus yilanensis TaxID=2485997 RepID=A0ABW4JAI8_9LACO|nr:iron-sulfur cluster biosynthesis family protein [Agrilactobacillus yilanensis]
MELNVKAAAEAYLKTKIEPGAIVFLATDDGSSKFSKVGGTCAIGNKFQLVVSDQQDTDYNIPMANNMGYQLFTSDGELDYLSNGLNLDYRNASLLLKDDSGILDGAVDVVNVVTASLATDQSRSTEMENLGGKIC